SARLHQATGAEPDHAHRPRRSQSARRILPDDVTGGPRTGPSSGPDTEPVTVGVDVGGTKILGLALDAHGAVLAEAKVPTPRLRPEHAAGSGGDVVIEAIA